MAEETTICTALRGFAEFVPGHGIVAGDPDASDGLKVPVPNSVIELYAKRGYIALPEGFAVEGEDLPEDESLADAAAALAEMTAAPVGDQQAAPETETVVDDAAPTAPAKPKK